MNIDLSNISANGIYHLMTQTVIPRPIAWVLSSNRDDSVNLAPFSYFNAVCSDPPLLMLSMGKKPDGNIKDTAANLMVGAHCVVHIAHVAQSEQVTNTAATLDYGVSEVDCNNIALTAHENWPLQRISACPIAYLCKVHSVQLIGNTPQQIVFVEALELFVDDNAVTEVNGRVQIDALKVDPLARLGANQYASLGHVLSKNRPK
ncbi:flavin reductase family protein [Glaciecola sp. SC05]|uniref:flavin reductase family protein n=1 Tax=Glaciecola sp. SC05 TaxID=1987355 RepID=UPI0035275C1C